MNNPTTLDWIFVAGPAVLVIVGILIAAGLEIYEEYFGSY